MKNEENFRGVKLMAVRDLPNFIYRFSLEYEVSQVVNLIIEVSKSVKKTN